MVESACAEALDKSREPLAERRDTRVDGVGESLAGSVGASSLCLPLATQDEGVAKGGRDLEDRRGKLVELIVQAQPQEKVAGEQPGEGVLCSAGATRQRACPSNVH